MCRSRRTAYPVRHLIDTPVESTVDLIPNLDVSMPRVLVSGYQVAFFFSLSVTRPPHGRSCPQAWVRTSEQDSHLLHHNERCPLYAQSNRGRH